MAYREVTRVETKEVLRQWVGGAGCKRISARLGLDVKTVRRYVHAAQALGLARTSREAALTDQLLTTLLASMRTQAVVLPHLILLPDASARMLPGPSRIAFQGRTLCKNALQSAAGGGRSPHATEVTIVDQLQQRHLRCRH